MAVRRVPLEHLFGKRKATARNIKFSGPHHEVAVYERLSSLCKFEGETPNPTSFRVARSARVRQI